MKKTSFIMFALLTSVLAHSQFHSVGPNTVAFGQTPYVNMSEVGTLLVTKPLDSVWDPGGPETVYSGQTWAIKTSRVRWTAQQITEADPTVPSWAKQPSKPAYSWGEISGKPTITNYTAGTGVAITGGVISTSVKAVTTYSGVTNASGNYTVTFPTAYAVAPNIQVCLINPNVRDTPIVTVSTTGFTVNIQRRNDVVGLLPTYANVNAGAVDVLITAK